MAIISTIERRVSNTIGDRKVTYGTFGDASSGGEIDTGLEICEWMFLQGTATTASGSAFVITGSLPRSGTAVPIDSVSSPGGIWVAYGR